MDVLDLLTVYYGSEARTIELHRGDLTNMSPHESVDLLIVSAFPNNYLPITGTSIGALYRRGVSVEELAKNKAVDLRHSHSCWLSEELAAPPHGIQIKRILCFEPPIFGSVTEVIGDMLRCLAPILHPDKPASIAIPLVATGDRGEPVSEVIAALLEATTHWMALGFPLRQVKLVEQSSAKAVEMRRIFERLKGKYPTTLDMPSAAFKHDVLISYAPRDSAEQARALAAELQRQRPDLRILLDQLELHPGLAWQQPMFDRIASCRSVIPLFSPGYVRSKACQEAFNLALYCQRAAPDRLLFPILVHDAQVPAYMQQLYLADARQADAERLQAVGAEFLAKLGS